MFLKEFILTPEQLYQICRRSYDLRFETLEDFGDELDGAAAITNKRRLAVQIASNEWMIGNFREKKMNNASFDEVMDWLEDA